MSTIWRKEMVVMMIGFLMPHITLLAQIESGTGMTSEVTEALLAGDVFLDYCISDTVVRVSGLSRDQEFIHIQSLNPLFWKCLKSYRRRLKLADVPGADIDGEVLYLYLVEPLKKHIRGKRRLMVRTDTTLYGIPFEAFIHKFESDGQGRVSRHYLIHDYEVVYVEPGSDPIPVVGKDYPSSWPESKIHFSFMGFSPTMFNAGNISALPDARHEIEQIGSMFRERGLSSWLVYESFSEKDYFKQVSPMGQIVHIATHFFSGKDERHPTGFVFWDYAPGVKENGVPRGVLTIDEIEQLELNADLVVLNACSSGIGYASRGHSKSIPLLFFRAGARNVVSTLWNVTDRVSGDFMIAFYRNILMGKGYSEALREVKLQMLSCRETAMPSLWAPYILTSR